MAYVDAIMALPNVVGHSAHGAAEPRQATGLAADASASRSGRHLRRRGAAVRHRSRLAGSRAAGARRGRPWTCQYAGNGVQVIDAVLGPRQMAARGGRRAGRAAAAGSRVASFRFILLSPDRASREDVRALRSTSCGSLRISSSRQILKPPAEIVTPRARSRRIRKNPDVASRTGVSPRAIRQANFDISTRDSSQLRGAAAGNVAAADHDVGAVAPASPRASAAPAPADGSGRRRSRRRSPRRRR